MPATSEIYTLSLHDALPILVEHGFRAGTIPAQLDRPPDLIRVPPDLSAALVQDRKSTRLNSSHSSISYAGFCLKKKILSGDNTEHYWSEIVQRLVYDLASSG